MAVVLSFPIGQTTFQLCKVCYWTDYMAGVWSLLQIHTKVWLRCPNIASVSNRHHPMWISLDLVEMPAILCEMCHWFTYKLLTSA